MPRVHIFYPAGGNERAFLFRDWTKESDPSKRPSRLVRVASFEVDESGEEAAEVAYGICNSYPGELHCHERYAALVAAWRRCAKRSMSVGDVVMVEDATYLCARAGFRELTVADLEGVALEAGGVA